MREEGVMDLAGPRRRLPPRSAYWRRVVAWTVVGLIGWLVVTWTVTWFATAFNRWTVAGAPAGYWLAAQGAIGAYLVIIVVHGWIMGRLERRAWDETPEGDAPRSVLPDDSPDPGSGRADG